MTTKMTTRMNFKEYINLCEEPLPGLGLIRTYRDNYRNNKSIQKAKSRRNSVCFNFELNNRCTTYKNYKKECYKMKHIRRILCNGLPECVVKYLFEFYSIDQVDFIPKINYYGITPKDIYKWYILISNILDTIHEDYHQIILNIHKDLPLYNYGETFKMLLNEIGKQKNLLQEGLHFDCGSNSLFDIAPEYKKYLYNKLFYMYYNIRL